MMAPDDELIVICIRIYSGNADGNAHNHSDEALLGMYRRLIRLGLKRRPSLKMVALAGNLDAEISDTLVAFLNACDEDEE